MKTNKLCKSEELYNQIINILDTFSGADGGAKFVCFKVGIQAIEKEALGGKQSAIQLLKVIRDFSKLLDILERDF